MLSSRRKLAPATVSMYRSALAKPLRLIFNIDVSVEPFNDFIKALFNLKPTVPQVRVTWSLDKVLALALSDRFQNDPAPRDQLSLYHLIFVSSSYWGEGE